MKKTDRTSLLFQLKLFSRGKEQVLSLVTDWLLRGNRLRLIMTPNSEQIVQSRGDDPQSQQFLADLQSADLLLPDGAGLVIASRILGRPIKEIEERIAGVWLVEELLQLAVEHDLKVLLIGGRDYGQNNFFTYQKAKIHWMIGYENVSKPTSDEEKAVTQTIKEVKPDLVLVAFGVPQQERWLVKHHALLEVNEAKVAMVVGGSFDFLLGKVKRAPLLLQRLGLEWLFRLSQEPWRWKRQLRLIKFVFLVFKERFN